MNTDQLIKDTTKDLEKLFKENYDKGVRDGAKFVIKTLRETMEISGSKVVYPMWLDTAEKELAKQEEQSQNTKKEEGKA